MTGTETLLLIGAGLYFLPSFVAYRRRTFNRAAVAIVDVFLGWTFIGWVVALAMAASGTREPVGEPGRSLFPWQRWYNRED